MSNSGSVIASRSLLSVHLIRSSSRTAASESSVYYITPSTPMKIIGVLVLSYDAMVYICCI
ncbi:hypothetical protein EDO6_06003 [Paenibacillus xylanexedens]|nr:hypothetical protein EDO6_06003 [Paenibacillus xylanexedens]